MNPFQLRDPLILLLLSFLVWCGPATAQTNPTGEALWQACGFCHGPQGQGGPALDAPPLAGMQSWYVVNQLTAFQSGWRGMHPEDVSGLQMSIASGMARNPETISNIAAYIGALPADPPPEMINGELASSDRAFLWLSKYAELEHPDPANAQAGQGVYLSFCVACHGATAQGNQSLGAPQLTSLPAWYIERQLQYFRDGVRGTHRDDRWGQTMAPFGRILTNNQTIADIAAYIETLDGGAQ